MLVHTKTGDFDRWNALIGTRATTEHVEFVFCFVRLA